MKQHNGQSGSTSATDLSRKVAKRTIGPATPAPIRPENSWRSAYRQSRGIKGLSIAILLALIGGLLWLGLRSGNWWLPEIQVNEESRVTLGYFLVFITVTLGLVASLAAAMWLTVSISKSRRIAVWPQADVRLPLRHLSLPFDANGECRPRVEFDYAVNGEWYRSGRLPPLARLVREAEADAVRREFDRVRWVSYNPRRVKEAYLLIPPHYLNSLRHETLCLGFALLMVGLLSIALWYVADDVIPVILRALK